MLVDDSINPNPSIRPYIKPISQPETAPIIFQPTFSQISQNWMCVGTGGIRSMSNQFRFFVDDDPEYIRDSLYCGARSFHNGAQV